MFLKEVYSAFVWSKFK